MSNPWVFCPYNKAHTVPQSRIQAHIVKCERKYPPLSICPHNATHRMRAEQLAQHVLECPATRDIANFHSREMPKNKSHPIKKETDQFIRREATEDDEW